MIDIKHLRQHPEDYQKSAELRGLKTDVKRIVELDQERGQLLGEVEQLRSELNVKGKPEAAELKKLQATKEKLDGLEKKLEKTQADLDAALGDVPNLLADNTPEGGEEANREEGKWGEAKPNSSAKDHLALAEANDWLDFERGAKTSGSKFYFVKGALVKLEMAVMRLAMDMLGDKGFTPMVVPHLVNGRTAAGTGFLPRGEERQIYKIEDEDLYLIATAEMPLAGYHADEILDPAKLPLLYAGISPAYRRESGAYGKHSKGIYRVHQFDKLEMFVYCLPEDSEQWLDQIVAIEEELAQALAIPYRKVRIAAGDMGAPATRKYDLEYWSPVDQAYRELTSASNCTDYQARRLGIRTRDKDGKTQYVHTLNGTAVAFSRMPVALLENHQTADGGVELPEALRPYYGASKL